MLELDLSETVHLTRDGAVVEIRSRKAQALLAYLAVEARPVSREALATLLWGDRFDDQALGDDADLIQGDEALSLDASRIRVARPADVLMRRFPAIAEEFDDWLTKRREESAEAAPEAKDPAISQADVVILPFDDLGGGETASFLAAETPRVLVSRAISSQFTTAVGGDAVRAAGLEGASPVEIAKAFGALAVMTGSARQIGGVTRLSLQGLDGFTGTPIWSQVELVEEDRSLTVADEIAGPAVYAMWTASGGFQLGDDTAARMKLALADERQTCALARAIAAANYAHVHSRHSTAITATCMALAEKAWPENPTLLAYHALATFSAAHMSDRKNRFEAYREAMKLVERLRARAPSATLMGSASIQNLTWLGRHEEAEQIFRQFNAHGAYPGQKGIISTSYAFCGRRAEVEEAMSELLIREGAPALLMYRHCALAIARFVDGDLEPSLNAAERAIAANAEFFMPHLIRIGVLRRLKRGGEAEAAQEEFRSAYRYPVVSEFRELPFADASMRDELLNALLAAGMPET